MAFRSRPRRSTERPWIDVVGVLRDVLPRQRVVAGDAGIPSGAAGDGADDAAAGRDRLASKLAEYAIPARVRPHRPPDAQLLAVVERDGFAEQPAVEFGPGEDDRTGQVHDRRGAAAFGRDAPDVDRAPTSCR